MRKKNHTSNNFKQTYNTGTLQKVIVNYKKTLIRLQTPSKLLHVV